MRRAVLAIALVVAVQQEARGARPLTLVDAIDQAFRLWPAVGRAQTDVERAKLAVLRAQLDRFSVRVAATLHELGSKSNILGPPLNICNVAGLTVGLDAATCVAMGGTVG